MKKLLKIIGAILAVLVILFVLAIVALVTLVNSNDFKGRISQAVYQRTGRELTIAGDINWSFYPWIGIKVNDISLSNAPQFKDKIFAKVGEADISIQLLPLFRGQIEAGKLTLKNISLYLMKDKTGQTNWQDLISKPGKDKPEEAPSTPSTSKAKSGMLTLISISGVNIDNANIFWNNEQIGQTAKIQHFQLKSDGIVLKRPFGVSSSFDFQTTKPDYSGYMDFKSQLIFDPNKEIFGLRNLKLTSYIKLPNIKNGVNIKFTSDFLLNLQEQTFSVKKMSAQIDNFSVNGEIEGSKILNAPSFKGNLTIPTFNPRQLLKKFSRDIPTQDRDVLQRFSAKLVFQTSGNLVNLPSFQATLDNTILQGGISKLDLNQRVMNFNLILDQFNSNPYKLKQPKKAKITRTATVKHSAIRPRARKLINEFNKWTLNGDLKVSQLTFEKFQFTNFNTYIAVDKGVINLSPIKANFYNGVLNADTKINLRSEIPTMSINTSITNAKLDTLLNDLANIKYINGTVNFSANLNSRGEDADSIFRNLNGRGKTTVKNGNLRNFNINYLLQFIDILSAKHFSLPKVGVGDSEFANLSGSFNIRNGLLSNKDFVMNATNYRVTGAGTINLVNQIFNYQLKAAKVKTVIKNGKPTQETSPLFIPIKVTGPISKPKYTPDLGHLAKQNLQKFGKRILKANDISKKITENVGKLF